MIDDYPHPHEWLGQKALDRVTYKHLFLMVLEAGRPKIKVLADLVSGENLLPGSYTLFFSLSPYTVLPQC